MSSPTATNYRIAQYDTFRNTEKVAYLQRQLLKNKLESQINFLKSLQRPEVQSVIDGLAVYATKIENARDKRDLLTIESRAGHIYFRNYAKLFDSKYGFYFQTRRYKTHCKTIISRRYVDRMAEKVVTSIIIFEIKYENNKYVNRSITISRNLPLRNSCHIAFSEPQDYNL
jgi:anaerobic selenocysteine-containing dehydrogenase